MGAINSKIAERNAPGVLDATLLESPDCSTYALKLRAIYIRIAELNAPRIEDATPGQEPLSGNNPGYWTPPRFEADPEPNPYHKSMPSHSKTDPDAKSHPKRVRNRSGPQFHPKLIRKQSETNP